MVAEGVAAGAAAPPAPAAGAVVAAAVTVVGALSPAGVPPAVAGTGVFGAGPPSAAPAMPGSASAAASHSIAASAQRPLRTGWATRSTTPMLVAWEAGKAQAAERIERRGEHLLGRAVRVDHADARGLASARAAS